MPQLLIKHLEDELVQQLRVKAATENVDVEHAAHEVLRKAMEGAPTAMPKTERETASKPSRSGTVFDNPRANPRHVLS